MKKKSCLLFPSVCMNLYTATSISGSISVSSIYRRFLLTWVHFLNVFLKKADPEGRQKKLQNLDPMNKAYKMKISLHQYRQICINYTLPLVRVRWDAAENQTNLKLRYYYSLSRHKREFYTICYDKSMTSPGHGKFPIHVMIKIIGTAN